MVHVHLVAHCYSGSHQCVEPLQKRSEEDRGPNETHGSAKVSGFGWHFSHKCRESKSSAADHYPLQKVLQHHPVKGQAAVCLLMWEGMALIIFQHGKPDRDASTAPAITSTVIMSTVKSVRCIFAWPRTETVFVPTTKWNKKAVKSFMFKKKQKKNNNNKEKNCLKCSIFSKCNGQTLFLYLKLTLLWAKSCQKRPTYQMRYKKIS